MRLESVYIKTQVRGRAAHLLDNEDGAANRSWHELGEQ